MSLQSFRHQVWLQPLHIKYPVCGHSGQKACLHSLHFFQSLATCCLLNVPAFAHIPHLVMSMSDFLITANLSISCVRSCLSNSRAKLAIFSNFSLRESAMLTVLFLFYVLWRINALEYKVRKFLFPRKKLGMTSVATKDNLILKDLLIREKDLL